MSESGTDSRSAIQLINNRKYIITVTSTNSETDMKPINYEQFPEDRLDLAMTLMQELNISDKELLAIEQEIRSIQDESKYMEMDLIYYGEPKAQARARHSKLGDFFYDPSQSLKAWLVEQITTQLPKNFKPIEGSIEMSCVFYKSMAKSLPKKTKILMELGLIKCFTKPDMDNFVKLVQDACNKVLYKDDAQIVLLHAEKFYSCKPRVLIKLKFRIAS